VVWFGPLDLTTMIAEQKPGAQTPAALKDVPDLLGCKIEDCAAQEAAASPVTYVASSNPPMLLIHGVADKTVPVKQSEEMAERLHKAGVPVETLYIPDADHGWIGPTPEITRSASLLALRRSFDFIDKIAGLK
jgi:dipeptidyl aminopeptidase/acylaminoacyl peptidase